MRFLFIISHDDRFTSSPKLVSEIVAWTKKRRGERVLVDSNPLKPSDEAVTVRVRDGKVRRTGGPFARSREKMCAYVLIEARSMEEAVSVATGHPMARAATIEVRPVWQELA
jgi:hypothetical protein